MVLAPASPSELIQQDREHLIHPLYHPDDHESPIIFASAKGSILKDVEGNEYIDGLSCLWNVAIGHGREELAKAGYEQLHTLAYASNYTGFANVPAIQLATELMKVVYPSLRAVYFTSGGAESNESAFKTARFYWKARGKPDKVKIVSRKWGYHGVSIAAMSATGIPAYHKMFGPLAPGHVHIDPPYYYRAQTDKSFDEFGVDMANELEKAILQEGPDTVAAFIAEPVQGAGGVIPPPPTYFPRIREICDQYDVLFIADEVITGFGRTGKMFALEHWGVEPDILSFAKAITSGYLPLGGIVVNEKIQRAILDVPASDKWMHAYTYSGHPTCCAVGLANLKIIVEEKLPERAARLAPRLMAGLEKLRDHPLVGDVRGLGLMAAVEMVSDKATKAGFEPSLKVADRLMAEFRARGLYTRVRGEVVCLAPPLSIPEDELDRAVQIVGDSIEAVAQAIR
ncbi:MAG: aspartate aminotransferase family protein [Chloroflexota bacterium]|nr:aspartate aminotransferase family protein [Chloroflexota bacterium]